MSKYTKEKLEEVVKLSKTYADVARAFSVNPVGGAVTHISRTIKKFGIDTSHFLGQGHNLGKVSNKRKKPEDIFIYLEDEYSLRMKPHLLKRALIETGIPYKCDICKIDEWMNIEIILHIDHIDGDYRNCYANNLRFLCPNCHSQTKTYCRKKRV